MQAIVRGLRRQALRDEEGDERENRRRRRSERIAKQGGHMHDSGTESDDEELQMLDHKAEGTRSYAAFLEGANPPEISASPPPIGDIDGGESWDSFGRESGILTGDGMSDDDQSHSEDTPTLRRRGIPSSCANITKDECEFPEMTMQGEKRKHSMLVTRSQRNQSIAVARPTVVAARRCAVRLLVNRRLTTPPPEAPPPSEDSAPSDDDDLNRDSDIIAAKRARLTRPALDFDKMLQTRLDVSGSASSAFDCIRPRRRPSAPGPFGP